VAANSITLSNVPRAPARDRHGADSDGRSTIDTFPALNSWQPRELLNVPEEY
jgi:hypothetical protein